MRWWFEQLWGQILFINWPLPPESIAQTLPPGLVLDTFEQQAWLSLVHIELSICPYFLPARVFGLRTPELNLRTYVCQRGRPGVYFYSLAVPELLATIGARLLYPGLNYEQARFCGQISDQLTIDYPTGAQLSIQHQISTATGRLSDRLTRWLTDRQRFFAWSPARQQLTAGLIDHPPWQLYPQQATVIERELLTSYQLPAGLPREPLIFGAAGLPVRASRPLCVPVRY